MRRHFPIDPATGLENQALLPWFDGDPVAGIEGSFPGHLLMTDAEAEILAAIRMAGLAPSDTLTQLVQSIARGGLWLGTFTGTADALAATISGSADPTYPIFLPPPSAGTRVRGIAAFANATATPVLTVTGIGSSAGSAAFPIVGSDGASAIPVGAWKAGQFLTFDIDAAGKARFSGALAISPTSIIAAHARVHTNNGSGIPIIVGSTNISSVTRSPFSLGSINVYKLTFTFITPMNNAIYSIFPAAGFDTNSQGSEAHVVGTPTQNSFDVEYMLNTTGAGSDEQTNLSVFVVQNA